MKCGKATCKTFLNNNEKPILDMHSLISRLLASPRLCALLTFCAAIVLSAVLIMELERAVEMEERTLTSDLATMQTHALEHKIRQALSATYAIASLIKENQGNVTNFESYANHLLDYHPGISALYIAPDGITSQVVPAEWRKKGLGINLFEDPVRKAEAILARDTQQLCLAGPLPLTIGGIGIIGRLPVFLEDSEGNKRFWGVVSVVISLPKILNDAELPLFAKRGYGYELWRTNPATGNKQIIDRSSNFQDGNVIRHNISLPNTNWTLDVMPEGRTTPSAGLYLKSGFGMLFSIMLAYLVKLLLEARQQKLRLKKLVEERTSELAAREADLCRAQAISKTGSWIADLNNQQIFCSEEAYRIWHVPPSQTVTCNTIMDRVHPEDRAKLLESWQAAQAGRAFSIEYRLLIDDKITWVHSQLELETNSADNTQRRVGTIQDITERKQYEEDLRVAAIAFEGQEGMVITDENRVILRINKAFTRITGFSHEEAIGKTTSLLKSGMHGASYYIDMSAHLALSGFWQGEIWNRRKNGEIYPEWLTITAVYSEDGKVVNYVGTMLDITQRKATEAKLEHLAYHDPLTGLANRRLLLDRLQHALVSNSRSHRHGAILFLDLDNFKTINDINGHGKGDMLLQQVAKRLTQNISKGDTLARIGGDEFALVIEDLSDKLKETAIEARSIANRIIEELNKPYELDGQQYHTTASIGIDLFRTNSISAEELLRQVEVAMYEAKASGGNSLCFFDPDMLNIVTARAAMEADIRAGIQGQQFILHYQPQVNSARKIIGAEALIRWKHPEKGMISPGEFIPLAEESGLIVPIGTWVLKTACQQLAVWAQRPDYAHLTMAINVSAKQFRQDDFVSVVLETIAETGIDPRKLKIELTESLLVDNIEETIRRMSELKAHGVCFSLDDFGTGYSSLSYLKRLPLDQLKIDQSFVRDILIDPNDAAITRTIIGLGKSLGLAVIAEGVETESQKTFLQSQDCHAFQGYLFGKPSPELILQSTTMPGEPVNS